MLHDSKRHLDDLDEICIAHLGAAPHGTVRLASVALSRPPHALVRGAIFPAPATTFPGARPISALGWSMAIATGLLLWTVGFLLIR